MNYQHTNCKIDIATYIHLLFLIKQFVAKLCFLHAQMNLQITLHAYIVFSSVSLYMHGQLGLVFIKLCSSQCVQHLVNLNVCPLNIRCHNYTVHVYFKTFFLAVL